MEISEEYVKNKLAELATSPHAVDSYRELQVELFQPLNELNLANNASLYAEQLLSSSFDDDKSKEALFNEFIKALGASQCTGIQAEVAQNILNVLGPNQHQPQALQLKLMIAYNLEEDEEYSKALELLESIQFNATCTPDEKAAVWVRIIRISLENGQLENTTSYINNLKLIIANVKDTATLLHFSLSQARCSDSKRAFIEAAQQYYNISLEPLMQGEERNRSLSQAIVCAVVAPMDKTKHTTLKSLYQDARSYRLPEYSMLEKFYRRRIITAEEAAAFDEKLAQHQRAVTADGSTMLQKVVTEHNLLAASKLYKTINLKRLATLLDTDAEKLQQRLAQLVALKQMSVSIDLISGIVTFDGQAPTVDDVDMSASVGATKRWDYGIVEFSERVEKVACAIEDRDPKYIQVGIRALNAHRFVEPVA